MATGVRDKITLACNECKRRNYMSTKSKRNTPDRLEVRKYCRWPGGGVRSFVAESWAELKKVEWPTQNQLIQGVVVVLIACVIVGVFLYAADLVFKRLVQDVLL